MATTERTTNRNHSPSRNGNAEPRSLADIETELRAARAKRAELDARIADLKDEAYFMIDGKHKPGRKRKSSGLYRTVGDA